MARIRTIKPGFFRSWDVAELPSDTCRLTWIGLWTYADDAGRGLDDARLVKGEIWPLHDRMTAKAVERDLEAIAKQGLICRYELDGRRYLHIVNWERHQRINRPQASVHPPCTFTEHSVNGHGFDSDDSRRVHGRKGREGKGREKEGKGSGMEASLDSRNSTTGAASTETGLKITHQIIDVCQGENRELVRSEAARVAMWATPVVDVRIIDEAIGWAAQAVKPPDLPRAVAAVISQKAADRGIHFPEFHP